MRTTSEVHVLRVDQPLSLDHCLSSKQAFRWEKKGKWWYGIIKGTILRLQQNGNIVHVESADANYARTLLRAYFRFEDDITGIYNEITKDRHMRAAVERYRGLRVLRQDPWECLASYICATYSNIPRIESMIANLCRRFGTPITLGDFRTYTFPTPRALAKANMGDLTGCGLGYRAAFLEQTAKRISESAVDLEELRTSTYEETVEALKQKHRQNKTLLGVGPKVADCVALYSLDKLEAFPLDIWVRRAMWDFYSDRLNVSPSRWEGGVSQKEYREINSFGRRYFGRFAGFANLFLFYYRRTLETQNLLTKPQ